MCEMRRQDRKMDKEFALKIIDKSRFATLSMIDTKDQPYGIPISFARDDNTIYFHSALEGKKITILKNNPLVSMSFVGAVKTPTIYSKNEIDNFIKKNEMDLLTRKIFTTEFESTILSGKVHFIENKKEKIKGLRLICNKYTPDYMSYFDFAVESSLTHTQVFRLDISEISGKRKKFDSSGEEMKWGRI